MSIRSFARKTAATLTLMAAAVPALAQQSTAVATSIVLTISTPSTTSFGEDVSGYAVVNSSDGTTLSGTVTFYDGTANICTIPVTQTTSCPPSAGTGFAAGTHLLTAVYSGDAAHLGSTSNGVYITVLPDTTTVNLTSSANPASFGQSVVLTATAQGDHAIPSGQIGFFDGTNLIAIATLNQAGVATLATSALTLGTHTITAQYAATQNFSGASTVLNQAVQPGGAIATVTTLASNVNPVSAAQNVTFTAAVSTMGESLVPTGEVTLLDGSTVLGTAPLNSLGLATFSTASLGTGSHTISASYAGNAVTAASSSTPLIEVVSASSATSQSPFTLTIAGTPTVVTGSAVNLLITVAPQTGTLQPVQLSCAGLPTESACTFGTATLPVNGGTTSLQISTMFPHSCESTTPYTQNAGLPFAGPALAGLLLLFIPRRRRKSLKGLLLVLVAACGMATLIGCGNCTDLGTRPGDYTIKIIGTSTGTASSTVITKIVLHVTVP
ncbi:Ig-like domain-containing protein [Edaphobacter paludis]|uniref:Ig-like domain-containing protein n=1 Tax=Edaphobacter paludis TaxID=3035702 RepID=A0AAU7D0P6_9BACT